MLFRAPTIGLPHVREPKELRTPGAFPELRSLTYDIAFG